MIGTLTTEQVEEVLKQNVLGRIGCHNNGKTYVVPINYAYDGKCIIAHSMEGMKVSIMRKNPEVCFEVDEMISFTKWKSVIAWGHYQELTSERDRQYAMKLFVEKMMHIKISSTAMVAPLFHVQANQGSSLKAIVYRIIITEKTGRFEDE